MDNQKAQNMLDSNPKREINFEKMPLLLQDEQWNKKYNKKIRNFRKIEIIGEFVIYLFTIFAIVFVFYIFLNKYHWHSNANDIKQSQNPSKASMSDLQETIIVPSDVNNANANKEYDDLHIIEFFVDKNKTSYKIIK